jgi:hypothetical protein
MRRSLIGLLLIFTLLLSGSRSLQGAIEIESLTIDVWPEFDRPDVLVIYHINLALQFQNFSQRMSLRIPREAGKPFALASRSVDGVLYDIKDYETSLDGDWVRVNFIPTGSEIQLEYYDTRLQKDGKLRSYEYRWPGDYSVKSLGIQIQQPVNAANLVTTPPIGTGKLGNDGLTYYSFIWGRVDSGTSFILKLGYEKNDNQLTMDTNQQQVKPALPIANNNSTPSVFQDTIPWLLGLLGIVMIIGVVIWYWRTDLKTNQQRSHRRRSEQKKPENSHPATQNQGASVFCQQCGKKAASGDVFCRACGTKLRYE